MAATTAGVDEIVGGSPTPLAPNGASGSGTSMGGQHLGHVGEGGDEVVGEARVADEAVGHDDLLHHRQAQALGDAALDLAGDLHGVEHLADVLAGRHLHDPHQPEVDVDVDDRPVGGEGVAHVGVALALVVERLGEAVLVHGRRLEGRRPGGLGHREVDPAVGSTRCGPRRRGTRSPSGRPSSRASAERTWSATSRQAR